MVECNDTQCALGAFESGQLIGVANYAMSREPAGAEVAVAVALESSPPWSGNGITSESGGIQSFATGLHYFVADILADNIAMLPKCFPTPNGDTHHSSTARYLRFGST